MKKTLLNISILAMVGGAAFLTSCRESFDYEEAYRQNPEFVYKENFEKAFGKIDPDQSWDFTMGAGISGTRAGDPNYVPIKDTHYVQLDKTSTKEDPKDILAWLQKELPEGSNQLDNTTKYKSFLLTVPEGGFRIVPIYQGNAGNDFEIHLVVENAYPNRTDDNKDYDVVVWCRNDIFNKSQGDFKYINSANPVTPAGTDYEIADANAASADPVNRGRLDNKTNLKAVFSKPMIFAAEDGISSPFPESWVGKSMYFYLRRINPNTSHSQYSNDRGEDKTYRSSLSRNFLYLTPTDNSGNIIAPSFLGSTNGKPNEFKVVGCEMEKYGDKDLNDAVFLIEGFPYVPKEHVVGEDGIDLTQHRTKRYMVEDLGATDESDIDFNDVVIDLTKVWTIHRQWTWTNIGGVRVPDLGSESTKIVPNSEKYFATIRALGGTKNLAIYLKGANSAANPESDPCIFVKDQYSDITPVAVPTYTPDNKYGSSMKIASGLTASIMYNTVGQTTNSKFSKNSDLYYNENDSIAHISLNGITTNQWSPDDNNIYIVVYEDDPSKFVISGSSATTIKFPENGTVPAMIAVDPEQQWNWERVNVFKNNEDGCYLQLTNGDAAHPEYNDYPKK